MSARGERDSSAAPTELVAETSEPAARPATPPEGARDRLGRTLNRVLPAERHLRLLWWVLLMSGVFRILWLDQPEGGLIFDESYYVNATRVLLGIPFEQGPYHDRPLGLDPNTEHPPLAKLLVAGSMALLGDDPIGWRIPSVAAGTASLLLLYGVARRVGADPEVALLATGLLAFDNLHFVHSRIFTLDIFQLAFMLLGLYWYVGGRVSLAGAGFALAALCKIGGAFGLLAMVGYELLRLFPRQGPRDVAWRLASRRLTRMALTFGLVFFLLLWLMDWVWVGYSHPFQHLQRIVEYGLALRRPDGPGGIESYPWQWLWNETRITYFRVDQTPPEGAEGSEPRLVILFLGAMNPYVLHLAPLGLALAAYTWWRRQPGADLAAVALAWFGGTYLPFWLATILEERIAYIYYFLPTLPAVTLAGSFFLLQAGLPRIVAGVYIGAVLLGFYAYFPFKALGAPP